MASVEKEFKVVKKSDEEFEFFLKMNADKKQIITKVTPGGPADRAGCKDGDILVEVNGKSVEDASHEDTVEIIRKSIPENRVEFKVNRPVALAASKPAHTKKSSSSNKGSTEMRPRLCKLVKKNGSFGFNLKGFAAREKQAHIVENIREGGAAEEAGLEEDDRIIKVNKANVEKLTHQQLVAIMKKSGNKVTMLVVDASTYHRYKTQKKKISEKDVLGPTSNGQVKTAAKSSRKATDSPLDGIAMDESKESSPRQLHVVPSEQGMGFFLRSKKGIAEEFAGGLEKDGAGYICGLRENDRIIAVNGESVHNKSHEDIISKLKENKHHVILIVLSPKSLSVIESKGIGSLGEMEVSTLEKPRIVKMTKGSDGYGFYLKMIKGEHELPHHILTDIEDGSAAEKAGLKNEEILASVNGTNIMHRSHQACVEAIRDSGEHVTLIVGSRESMNIFYKLKIEISEDFLDKWPKAVAFHKPEIGDFIKKRLASIRQSRVSDNQELIPRLCHLTKDQHSYSFYLRDDDGCHLLEQVEDGGAAHMAGVREGDVIIEVNGVSVLNEGHDDVVNRIRERKNSVTFLVADEATRSHFSVKGIVITAKLLDATKEHAEEQQEAEKPKNLLNPRFCHLVKDRTFGFHLNSEQNVDRPGQYIRQVAEGGVADVAGVKEGDRIIEINGENIESKSHKDVVGMIVTSGTEVDFLVVDEEADLHFKQLGVLITLKLINDDGDDKRSVTSSLHSVQAEATVHDEPINKVEIVIDHVEDRHNDDDLTALQSIEAAIDDEILDDDVKEQLVDSGWEGEIRKEVRESDDESNGKDDGWNKGDEIREEIREEIVEEIVEEAKEEVKAEIVEEIREDIREEIVEEIKEDIREERREERIEEFREEIREEIKEDFKEEIREEIREEAEEEMKRKIREEAEEDMKRKMREEAEEELKRKMREEAEEEMKRKMREEAEEELKRKMREEAEEELKRKIREEAEEEMKRKMREEAEEELKRRIREEMKQETQEEMMARIREEVKREMLAEAAAQVAVSAIKIPEPPSTPPSPVVREKADSIRSIRSTTSSTTSSQLTAHNAERKKSEIDFAEINNVRLRPVKQRTSKKSEPEPEPEEPRALPVQNSIRARMAMFEQNRKAAAAAAERPKVNVVVAAATVTASQPSPSSTVTSPRSSKPFTFKSASQMSFKIVETTPVIN